MTQACRSRLNALGTEAHVPFDGGIGDEPNCRSVLLAVTPPDARPAIGAMTQLSIDMESQGGALSGQTYAPPSGRVDS